MQVIVKQIRTELTEILSLEENKHYNLILSCIGQIRVLLTILENRAIERSQANGKETGQNSRDESREAKD